jgi:[ribosomal protein S5]-alanine N-acetyltransferase
VQIPQSGRTHPDRSRTDAMPLRSYRLLLEPLRPADLASLHGHWTEPEVRRYLWDGRVILPEEAQAVIETSDRLFREHGAGLWSLRAASAPELIGAAGFWHFHDPPELELLLSVCHCHWGRGLAREAAETLLEHAFQELDWPAVQASADAPNGRSLELMRRLGLRPAGERPGEFGVIEVFRISRANWRARRSRQPGTSRGVHHQRQEVT